MVRVLTGAVDVVVDADRLEEAPLAPLVNADAGLRREVVATPAQAVELKRTTRRRHRSRTQCSMWTPPPPKHSAK